MTRIAITAALPVLLALGAASSVAAGPAPAGAPDELVLVSSESWLYAAPDEKAHRFRFKKFLPSMKRTYKKGIFPLYATARPRRVIVFRLAEPLPAGPGWVHLQNVDDALGAAARCDFLSPGPGLRVDLWVKTSDLLPTLDHPFQGSFEEGGLLRALPGVALRPAKKAGLYLAETPTLQAELPLLPQDLAQSFRPQERLAVGPYRAFAKGPVKLLVSGEIKATLYGVDMGLAAEPVRRIPGSWLISAEQPCVRVKGFGRYRKKEADPAASRPRPQPVNSALQFRVAKGSSLFWPDGSPAGQVTGGLQFSKRDEVRTELDHRRCAKIDILAGARQVLCFPKDRVRR